MSAEDATAVVADKPQSASPQKPSSKPASSKAPASGAKKATKSSGSGGLAVGDIVLARLKGFPPWPARIADADNLPPAVSLAKPPTGRDFYPCQYFPAGDFSWLHTRDIKPLSKSEIDAFLAAPHRKPSGGLKEAYQTARDPQDWLEEQEEILKQKQEEQEAADEDVDELADDDEPAGGKRKRATQDKKSAKKSKSTKAAPAEKEKKPVKAKKVPESEAKVENQASAEDDLHASDPECIRVKDWRHKLQRAFLGKALPTAGEMDTLHELFNKIEEYKDMTIDALQYSKIGKVMRKIATLENVPRNEELKITERASKLMNEWSDFINNGGEKPNGTNGESKEAPASAAAETSA